MKSNKQKLEVAISSLVMMKDIVKKIYKNNTKALEGNKDLAKSYKELVSRISVSIERLKNPTLSIAMVGTTSAGKSTIVNALAGRTIAPMESEEMSAGVLRLIPSEEKSLKIAHSEHWESGIFQPITDKDAYSKIENIFEKYHRFEKNTTPPEIIVSGPLLWSKHPELIGLPKDVSLEFIDLPGLKTLTDRKNLEVIKKHLSRSLCIIAMDYNDVDRARVKRLLEEVEDIVKALNGNDKSLLFLLNKVDARAQADKPLGKKIESLTNEIRVNLSLKEDTSIEIIPFIARLFYYAQSALGDAVIGDTEIHIDYNQIGKLIIDHSNQFTSSDNPKIKETFDRVNNCFVISKDKYGDIIGIKPVSEPNKDDIFLLISECYKLSHADWLMDELKRRISDSFSTIIILPAVLDTFKAIDDFCTKLKTYVDINKNNNLISLLNEQLGLLKKKVQLVGCPDRDKDEAQVESDKLYEEYGIELERLRQNITEIAVNEKTAATKTFLLKEIKKISNKIDLRPKGEIDLRLEQIEKDINYVICNILQLSKQNTQFYQVVVKFLSEIKGKKTSTNIFIPIIDVPRTVKEKLDLYVISRIKSCLENNEKQGELQEKLLKDLALPLVAPLLPSYETTRKTFEAWKNNSSYAKKEKAFVYNCKSKVSDENIKATEDMYLVLNRRVREILYKKTNLLFQLESQSFIGSLRNFLNKEVESIIELLNSNLGNSGLNIGKYIADSFSLVDNAKITLPEKLFEFAKPDFDPKVSLGHKWVADGTETYEEGSCCPTTKTRTKYKMVDDNTYSYPFPNATGLYDQWFNGINKSEILFWMVLSEWIDETVKNYLSKLTLISKESVNEINNMISERIKEMKESNSQNEQKLSELLDAITKLKQKKSDFDLYVE